MKIINLLSFSKQFDLDLNLDLDFVGLDLDSRSRRRHCLLWFRLATKQEVVESY